MNLPAIVFRILLLVCAITIVLVLSSCESDPILAPQSEVAEEGGSYGNTNLPVGGTGNAGNTAQDEQNSKIDRNPNIITNPKRF
ncbi:hypothetical protein C6496_21045 [Candidatus Poribacteria bacterium]|nr:MAG: hypothetical protein C6496_21045 [Candidatus Poribacteria bacterium]